MKKRNIFLEGNKKPFTIGEVAEMTGIDASVLSMRATRCVKKEYFKSELCPVLSDKDLQPPIKRNVPRRKALNQNATAKKAIDLWNKQVRLKNGR